MDGEALALLKENNTLLKDILARLDYLSSEAYRSQEDIRQFCINVVADIFVEALEDGEPLRDKVNEMIRQKK